MGVLHTSVLNICGFFSAKQNTSIKVVYLPLSPRNKKVSSPEMPFNEQPKHKSLLDYSTFHTAWKNLDLCRYAMEFFCIPTPLSHYNEELVHQFYQNKAN